MEFSYRYYGHSSVGGNTRATAMSFAPDTLREPAFFVARLNKCLPFREAISALHRVVVSDLRFKPKDRSDYLQWAARNETDMLTDFLATEAAVRERTRQLQQELGELRRNSMEIMRPYYKAQRRYFDYLYKQDYDAWFVLDPVITVHPDEVFFECFSQDESSYGRLACNYEVFSDIQESFS